MCIFHKNFVEAPSRFYRKRLQRESGAVKWHRLQPVWFDLRPTDSTQAEACATRDLHPPPRTIMWLESVRNQMPESRVERIVCGSTFTLNARAFRGVEPAEG